MFGFFRKKKNKDFFVEPSVRENLIRTAQMIDLSFQMSQFAKDYAAKINSPFCRGYIFGFFDASLQYSNAKVENDEQFASTMAFAHMALFGSEIGFDYFVESNKIQKDNNFQIGQAVGGAEYFEFMDGKIKSPYRLQDYIMDQK